MACYNFMLAQMSWDSPVLANLTNEDLIKKIHNTLADADCWFKVKLRSPNLDGTKDLEYLALSIWAVGWHQSGNIWVATGTEAEHKMLVEMIHKWLPRLSVQLSYIHKTYPVVVHGIPTAFNMSCNGQDITINLISNNTNIITHPSMLQHAEFLT